MELLQFASVANDYSFVRGPFYLYLWLWFLSHPSRRHAVQDVARREGLSEATKGTGLLPALCFTRSRRTRWQDGEGRRYELVVQRATFLEVWLAGYPRHFLATVHVHYPPKQTENCTETSGRTMILGSYGRSQDAWKAIEEYLSAGGDE